MRPYTCQSQHISSTDQHDASQSSRKLASLFPLTDEGVKRNWDTPAYISRSTHCESFDIGRPAHALGEKIPSVFDSPSPVPQPDIITVPVEKILDSPGRHDRPSQVSVTYVFFMVKV